MSFSVRPLLLTMAGIFLLLAAACTSVEAPDDPQPAPGLTPWLPSSEVRAYVERVFKRELYATRIECRPGQSGDVFVRFHTARGKDATKPFHKWQFVITEPGGLEAAIRAIPLRDRPDLQYRIVSQDRAGDLAECAVVYR